MHDLMPLAALTQGMTAIVSQLVGRAEHVQRLREMGLSDGTRLEVLHSGRPCILRVGSQRLCIRDSEMTGVLVRVEIENDSQRNTARAG